MPLPVLAALALIQTPIPAYPEMAERIAAQDAALFWAAFEGCDPKALGEHLHEDFRMLHDKAGLALASRADFLASMEEQCAARASGGDNPGYRNRRLLTPGTRIVRPLGNWGALEEGSHGFYEYRDGNWELTGGARYMHVWQWMTDEGKFRLIESISYDHGAARAYPPANKTD